MLINSLNHSMFELYAYLPEYQESGGMNLEPCPFIIFLPLSSGL